MSRNSKYKPVQPKPICVAIESAYLSRIDAIATSNKVTRSEVIRAAIFKELAVQEALIASKTKGNLVGCGYEPNASVKPKASPALAQLKRLVDELSK